MPLKSEACLNAVWCHLRLWSSGCCPHCSLVLECHLLMTSASDTSPNEFTNYDYFWRQWTSAQTWGQPGCAPNNWETPLHSSVITTFCPPNILLSPNILGCLPIFLTSLRQGQWILLIPYLNTALVRVSIRVEKSGRIHTSWPRILDADHCYWRSHRQRLSFWPSLHL